MHHKDLFEAFFHSYSTVAYQLSWSDRQKMEDPNASLTFGQMQICSLHQILELIQPGPRDRLIDLGSGIGKLAMGAHYLYPDLPVTGVEILPSLHQLAETILSQFSVQLAPRCCSQVQLICADMFDVDLKGYTIAFVNSTCMDEELLNRIVEHLSANLRLGAKVVSLGRALRSEQFKLWKAGAWRMSWQVVGHKTPVFIYEIVAAIA